MEILNKTVNDTTTRQTNTENHNILPREKIKRTKPP